MKYLATIWLWAALCVSCFAQAGGPANIFTVYSNGPLDGYTNAWTISAGYVVSDTFNVGGPLCAGGGCTITGFSLGVWVYNGDVPFSVEYSITSSEFGGTTYADGIATLTNAFQFNNGYQNGVCCDIYESMASITPLSLAAGTYWFNLENGTTTNGDPLFWDENSGPSLASENTLGTIPSEDPDFFGYSNGASSVPEPGSILLFGSGVLGLGALLTRRINL